MNARLGFPALLLGLASWPVHADVAPPGSEFLPREAPPKEAPPVEVQMAAEEVALTLSPHELQVAAVFHMHNPGKKNAKLQVTFPAGPLSKSVLLVTKLRPACGSGAYMLTRLRRN